MSKATTVAWGVLIIVFAFLLGGEETVVERINKVGSAFYGPILAAFVAGLMIRRVRAMGMVTGILSGVGINLLLWLKFKTVFWMWWNVTGCVVACAVAMLVSLLDPAAESGSKVPLLWDTELWKEERRWIPVYLSLFVFFIGAVLLCAYLPDILSAWG